MPAGITSMEVIATDVVPTSATPWCCAKADGCCYHYGNMDLVKETVDALKTEMKEKNIEETVDALETEMKEKNIEVETVELTNLKFNMDDKGYKKSLYFKVKPEIVKQEIFKDDNNLSEEYKAAIRTAVEEF